MDGLKHHREKLNQAVKELSDLQKILMLKKPSYDFLDPVINNAITSIVDLIVYLEGRNPYFKTVNLLFSNNRQTCMHRTFFSDLLISSEEGLMKIIKDEGIDVVVSKRKLAESIVTGIQKKLSDTSNIEKELKKIIRLGGSFMTFNDHLNAVLGHTKLSVAYKQSCRAYFDALSIIRNKVSHSNMDLSELEKLKLKKGKFTNAISKDGTLQMTYEGYAPLLKDVVRFFDTINANS